MHGMLTSMLCYPQLYTWCISSDISKAARTDTLFRSTNLIYSHTPSEPSLYDPTPAQLSVLPYASIVQKDLQSDLVLAGSEISLGYACDITASGRGRFKHSH